jgi:DMSO/TMAO reductase YedYZ molybdopterin-dependent catalytic subunit
MPPPGTFILVNGAVMQPQYITLDQLQKMRSTSITQKISGHGIVTVTGVPLADVIALARPNDTGGTDGSPNAYALITNTQSQTALVAFPEFEKAFAGKIVLLAYLLNGKPPKAGAATLVVQGDASAGRFIEGVSHILVVQPSPSP